MVHLAAHSQSLYPVFPTKPKNSRLAQLVERETVNLEVSGSIPLVRAFWLRATFNAISGGKICPQLAQIDACGFNITGKGAATFEHAKLVLLIR
jgi:hypothetical protein